MKIWLASTLLVSSLAAAAPASAQMVILGASPAATCYRHAHEGDTYREALADCDTAIQSGQTNQLDMAATYVNRAIIHTNRSEFDMALADIEKSFSHQDLAEAYAARAVVYMRMGEEEKAAEEFTLALMRDDLLEPHKIHFNRAIAFEELDRIEDAYHDFKKAAELAPDWEAPREQLTRFTVVSSSES